MDNEFKILKYFITERNNGFRLNNIESIGNMVQAYDWCKENFEGVAWHIVKESDFFGYDVSYDFWFNDMDDCVKFILRFT